MKPLEYSQKAIQPIIEAQKELARIAGKAKKEFPLVITPSEVTDFCEANAKDKVIEALAFDSYTERKLAIEAIVKETSEAMEEKFGADSVDSNDIATCF